MGKVVDRLKHNLVGRWLITYFVDSPGPHYAPAIAFNAFVAIFPITVGLLALLVILNPGNPIVRQVDRTILDVFPQGTRGEIAGVLGDLNRHARTVVVLSLIAMIWAGSALFACLGAALNAMHGTPGRNLLHQRLMGLRLIAVMVFGLGVLIVLEDVTDGLPAAPVIGPLIAGVVLVMLLVFIYRVAPNVHRRPRDVLPGAVLAAVLIEAVTLAFPLYGRVTSQISTYGRGLALALALLFWLYIVSHILLLGAHFNAVARAELEAIMAEAEARAQAEGAEEAARVVGGIT
jgi:membrane protein